MENAQSEKSIETHIEDNKDQMEINKGQIDVNNDPSSVQKRQPVEDVQLEESINKGNTVNDQSNIPDPISAKKYPINLKVKATRKHGFSGKRKSKWKVVRLWIPLKILETMKRKIML